MDNVTVPGMRRPGRRFLVGAATVAAGALFASSAAYGCTLRQGVLEVWRPLDGATCLDAGIKCSRTQGTALIGVGAQVKTTGEWIKVRAYNLPGPTEDYNTTWRQPGSSSNCHRQNPDGSVVQLIGNRNGPAFEETVKSPNTSSRAQPTGLARICVQEQEFDLLQPTVVVGQLADVNVVL